MDKTTKLEKKDYSTPQERKLLDSGLCAGVTARSLGLSFADRDVDLIEYLKTVPNLERHPKLPSVQACVELFGVEERWASMVLDRVGQFMRKAARGDDYSEETTRFNCLPDVQKLLPKLRQLKPGMTAFIGDSSQDSRHWSSNAPFPVLTGSLLQELGVGPYLNNGVGGTIARQGIARFDSVFAGKTAARMVVGFGGNDAACKIPMADFLRDMTALIQRSQSMGASVVLQGTAPRLEERMWWIGEPIDPDTNKDLDAFTQEIRNLAGKTGSQFLDLKQTVTEADLCCDGIHLLQSGHDKIAIKLLQIWTEA